MIVVGHVTLWVDHEGPSSRVVYNDTIVNGERVHRQTSNIPRPNLDWFTKGRIYRENSGTRNLLVFADLVPLCGRLESEIHREGTEVGHDSRGNEHISRNVDVSFSQLLGSLTPSLLLSPETSNQLLGSLKLLGTKVNVGLKVFLFLCHCSEFIVESLELV